MIFPNLQKQSRASFLYTHIYIRLQKMLWPRNWGHEGHWKWHLLVVCWRSIVTFRSFLSYSTISVQKRNFATSPLFNAPSLKYSGGIFWNLSSIYTAWCAHNFSRKFVWGFPIFYRNFVNIVVPSSDENENYVVHLKALSLPKKGCKTHRSWPTNRDAMLVQTMHPLNEQWSRLG